MITHYNFISKSLIVEMEKAAHACRALSNDISSQPLKDYIFQSLFLRLTGFQEQKLRCICWDCATVDYGYRRKLLSNDDKLGEYSKLDAKNAIYSNLIGLIKELDGCKFNSNNYIEKQKLLDEAKLEVVGLFEDSCFKNWCEKEFYAFKRDKIIFKVEHFANDGLLDEPLVDIYQRLYRARNFYAHNVLSYQENIPPLRSLTKLDLLKDNFFTWFTLLNLIDKVFTKLFIAYLNRLKEENY